MDMDSKISDGSGEMLRRLCVALGEPFESASEHPSEPPYRMTWDRAFDLLRGKVQVWRDLLIRAQMADADWLNEYRRASGSVVPVAQCGKTNKEAGMPDFYYQDWRCGKPVGHEGHCTPYSAETAELRAAAVPVATPTEPDWKAIAEQAVEALRLTREYVQPKVQLSASPGWSWFDASNRYLTACGLPPLPEVPVPAPEQDRQR